MIFGTYYGKPVKKSRRKMANGILQDSDMVIFGKARENAIPLIQREIRSILDNSNDSVYLIVPSSEETGRYDVSVLSDILESFVNYTYFENFYVKYDLKEVTLDVLSEEKQHTRKWLYFLNHTENNKWLHRDILLLKDLQKTAHITMTFQADIEGLNTAEDNKPAADEVVIRAYGETPLRCPLICLYNNWQESYSYLIHYLKRIGCVPKTVHEIQRKLNEEARDPSCDAVVVGKDVNGEFHVQPFLSLEAKGMDPRCPK